MKRSNDIPQELIEEILSISPFKSNVRFKSVSKQWHNMISDPRFSRIHRTIQRSKQRNTIMFMVSRKIKRKPKSRMSLMRLEDDGHLKAVTEFSRPFITSFTPVCSCNGIFLLSRDNIHYMLFNLSIQESTMISNSNPCHDRYPCMHHMYYDADDYKIVFVYKKHYMVYSCKNQCWGEEVGLPCNLGRIDASVDGCLYGLRSGGIVFFDVRDGKRGRFQLPEGHGDISKVDLVENCGRLCLWCWGKRNLYELWVMEKSGRLENCWRKLMSMYKREEKWDRIELICLTDEDDVVIRPIVWNECSSNENSKLLMYNSGERVFQEIEFDWSGVTQISQYQENLYMPSKFNLQH